MIFCWSCDEGPLKWNKKNSRASSLPVQIKWVYSTLDPPPKWSVNAFKLRLLEEMPHHTSNIGDMLRMRKIDKKYSRSPEEGSFLVSTIIWIGFYALHFL